MSRRRATRETMEQSPIDESDLAEDVRPATFWDQVAAVTEEEWSNHRLYLYRVSPTIDLGSDRNYIARYQRAVDEETILADHGSGTYYAVLNNTRDRRAVATHTFSLYRLDCPPKVDFSQVVRCPENETFFNSTWVKGPNAAASTAVTAAPDAAGMERLAKLAVDTVRQQTDRPSVDPALVDLFQKATAERDNLAARLVEFANKPAPPQGPDPLTMLQQLIATSKELHPHPPPAPTVDPMVMMRELLSTVTALQKAATPPPPPPQKSFLEGLKEITEAVTAMRSLTPEPAESPAPSADNGALWAQIAAALAPALQPLTQALAMRMMSNAQTAMQPPAMPSTLPAVASMAGTPEAAKPAAPAADPQPQPTLEQEQTLMFMRAIEVPFGNYWNQDRGGDEFADWLIDSYGRMAFDQIISGGPDLLTQALVTYQPIGRYLQQNPDRAQQFISDFVNRDRIADAEEASESDHPSPKAA